MSKIATILGGNAVVVVGGAAAVAAAVIAAVVGGVFETPEPEKPEVPNAVVATPDVTPEVEVETPTPEAPAEETAALPQDTPQPDPVPTATPEPVYPAFDVVRVEADGNTLIAGTSAPEAMVTILLDDLDLASAAADGSGKFVSFVEIPLSDRPRTLTLVQRRDEGDLFSKDTVIIAPSAPVIVAEADIAEPVTPVETAPVETTPEPTPVADPEPQPEPVVEVVVEAVVETEAAPETTPEPAPQPLPTPEPEAAPVVAEAIKDPGPAPKAEVAEPAVDVVVDEAAQPTEVTTTETSEPDAPATQEIETAEATPVVETPSVTDAAAEPVAETVAEPTVVAEVTPEAAPVETAEEEIAEEPRAPTVILANEDGVKILQSGTTSIDVMSTVTIDSISYSNTGAVMISGQGREDAFVRVYLDNHAIADAGISSQGIWSTELDDVEAGIYVLRVDELDAVGKVTSRVETPFQREAAERVAEAVAALAAEPVAEPVVAEEPAVEPEAAPVEATAETVVETPVETPVETAVETPVAEDTAPVVTAEAETPATPAPQEQSTPKAPVEEEPAPVIVATPETPAQPDPVSEPKPAAPRVRLITVQPGSTLWAIARDTYGDGVLYVRVFDANKDKIRDPDLIYPGQIFSVPAEE